MHLLRILLRKLYTNHLPVYHLRRRSWSVYQFFWLLLAEILCLAASYIVLNKEYRKPTHRGARTAVFLTLGLCGVIPVTHGLFAHGYQKLLQEMGFRWLLTSAALYINGALL